MPVCQQHKERVAVNCIANARDIDCWICNLVAKVELMKADMQDGIEKYNAAWDAMRAAHGCYDESLTLAEMITVVVEAARGRRRVRDDNTLVAFLSRPDISIALLTGKRFLVYGDGQNFEGRGGDVISAARAAMFMHRKYLAAQAAKEK